MINIKYFVLLMVGIFLALGLGMMIGITLENQNIIENQQTQMIHQIEDHFVNLRTETEQMKLELSNAEDQKIQLQELSSLLLTELIQGKLTGMHIGLVSFSNKPTMNELLDFLDLAGASVQSAVSILYNNKINSDTTVHAAQQPDEMITAIVQELLYSMDYSGITPLVQEAEGMMLVSHVRHYEYPVDMIILIGQGISTFEYDNILIQSATDRGIPLVAVEAGEIENSAISKYKALGISTIDHVESIYGRLALVSVLSGNKGNFGFGSVELDKLPKPLFYEEPLSDLEGRHATNEGDYP